VRRRKRNRWLLFVRWPSFAAASHRSQKVSIVHSTVSYANLVPSSQLRGYRIVPNVHTEQEGYTTVELSKSRICSRCLLLVVVISQNLCSSLAISLGTGKCFARFEMKRQRRLMCGDMLASSVIQDGKVEESRVEETRVSADCQVTSAILGCGWSVVKFQASVIVYKAATRPKMARRPAPVAESAAAAPSKGADSLVDSVGAPVPEGAGATMGIVPLAEG
jgi:hypothetical protein